MATNQNESTPLMSHSSASNNNPSNRSRTASNSNYYFLMQDRSSGAHNQGGDGTTRTDDFASRPVMVRRPINQNASQQQRPGLFARLFSAKNTRGVGASNSGTITITHTHTNRNAFTNNRKARAMAAQLKKNQAAIKIEPKVFFANERTFLAWLHTSVLLAGASIAMSSFVGEEDDIYSQLYGIVLLPISIAFLCYAMHQYGSRSQMIRKTTPGPYEDIVGPSVLAIALMCSIVAQFAIKVYSIM